MRLTPFLAAATAFSSLSCSAPLFAQTQSVAAPRSANFRTLGVLLPKEQRSRVRIGRGAAPAIPAALRSKAIRVSASPSQSTNLSFSLVGFSSENQSVLSRFLRSNYNRMVTLWGQPAPSQRGKTVIIRGDGNEGDAIYFPPASASSSSGGDIFFNYKENFDEKTNTYNLARVIFLSFWGAHVPSYEFLEGRYVEPWVFGMSNAAAALIAFQDAGSPSNWNPSAIYDDLLPVYDYFNRPELGGAYIFSPDGKDLVIADFRLSMAQAAFLKMAIEKPTFFSDFNTAYYARTSPRQPISMESLKTIAATVLPTVENRPFQDWARSQYVLDGTITTGQKLYVGLLPLPDETTGDTRGAFQAYVQAFTTDAAGVETPSTGYGSVSAFDLDGRDLTFVSRELTRSNIVEFNDTRTYPGQGYNFTNSTGQRLLGIGFSTFNGGLPTTVTVKFRFKDAEATAYFPYRATGNQNSPLSYFGAVPGVRTGTLQLNNSTVNVRGSTFRANTTYTSSARVQTTLVLNGKTLKRNTAWLAPASGVSSSTRGVGFLLDVPPSNSNFNFQAPGGTSAIRMVSFPFFPSQTDEAAMLGLPANSLALARFRPNLSPAARQGDALVFGIGTDRHELYPQISTPVAPGKGYWLGTGTAGLSRTIAGGEPPRTQAFEFALVGGWNQIGPPFNRAFSPASLKVRYAGFAPVSLQVAQSRGWVAPGIWRWQPGGGYARVDVSGGGNLEPFVGYYIFASAPRGTFLVWEPTASTTAQLAARNGWSIALTANGQSGRDTTARFGVSGDANVAKPPTGPQILTVSLGAASALDATKDAGAAAQSGSGLAESYARSLGNGLTWRAVVDGTQKGDRITLSWGVLSGVPKGLTLKIRDQKEDVSKIMTPRGVFRFVSEGAPRVFTFTIAPASSNPSATSATSTSATSARSGGSS